MFSGRELNEVSGLETDRPGPTEPATPFTITGSNGDVTIVEIEGVNSVAELDSTVQTWVRRRGQVGEITGADMTDMGQTTTDDTAVLVDNDTLDPTPTFGAFAPENAANIHCHVPREKGNKVARNQLIAVSVLCLVFMIAEIIGGIISNSLALITDATHLASDLTGFLVSLAAIWMATKPPTAKMSFGYYRAEVLGAMISILIIWVITGVLIYEAIKRVIDQDYEIEPNAMLVTASLGVIFNIIMGLVLNFGTCCGAVAHSHGLGGHGHSHGGGNGHNHGDSHSHSHGDNHTDSHHHGQSHGHSHGDNHSDSHHHGQSHGGGNGHSHGDGHSHSHNHSDSHHHGQSHGHGHGDNQTSNHGNNTESHQHQDHCHDNQPHSDNHQPAYAPQDGATDYDGRVDIQDIDVAKFKDKRNINVRAAFIHVIGDLIQSIGVFIAAVIIKIQPDYKLADPICTFVFSVLVLFTTTAVLRDAIMVLMEGVPRDVNFKAMKRDLEGITGVKAAHSLNVWALTMDKNAVAVHLAVDSNDASLDDVLKESTRLLRDRYQAFQSTVQVEPYQELVMANCDQCRPPRGC